MENFKTLLLIVLVGLSLMQSFLLGFPSPQFDPISQEKYVKAETFGTKLDLEDLLFPDQIVLHAGAGVHSVTYPSNSSYKSILENVKQRYIEGFRKFSPLSSTMNLEDYRTKGIGVELRFRDGIPLDVLSQLMQIKGELPTDNETITRVWIMAKENREDLKTIFFTDTPNVAFEAIKADFTAKDIENILASGDNIPYHSTNGEYYLPNKPLTTFSYKLTYTPFTEDQLRRSLFVDPNVTRSLTDREGSLIYTDGKRGLQISQEERWMTFSDPASPVEGKNDFRENVLSAIQFVNQHGGWNGKYALSKTPQKLQVTGQAQTVMFRQYYETFPIIATGNEMFGHYRLVLQKGTVSRYERSMIREMPEFRINNRKEVQLLAGEELDAKITSLISAKKGSVINIFPAYKPVMDEKTLDLIPVWAVELRDGSYEYLE